MPMSINSLNAGEIFLLHNPRAPIYSTYDIMLLNNQHIDYSTKADGLFIAVKMLIRLIHFSISWCLHNCSVVSVSMNWSK